MVLYDGDQTKHNSTGALFHFSYDSRRWEISHINGQIILSPYSGKGRYSFALKTKEKSKEVIYPKTAKSGHAAWSPGLMEEQNDWRTLVEVVSQIWNFPLPVLPPLRIILLFQRQNHFSTLEDPQESLTETWIVSAFGNRMRNMKRPEILVGANEWLFSPSALLLFARFSFFYPWKWSTTLLFLR